MVDDDVILVPEKILGMSEVDVPAFAPFRRYQFSKNYIYNPALEAIDAAGWTSLPESVQQRLDDLVPRIKFKSHPYYERRSDEERAKYEIEQVKRWRRGSAPSFALAMCGSTVDSRADFFLRFVLQPADFTLEQRTKIFERFALKIMNDLEREYCEKIEKSSSYTSKQVYLVSENCTLKEWHSSRCETVEKRLAEFLEAELAIRHVDEYKWGAIEFIFGHELPTLSKIQASDLLAKLKISCDAVRTELNCYLKAVEDASQTGSMRYNSHEFSSTLVDKFKVWIYIRDVGRGAAVASEIRSAAKDAKDVVQGVGSLAILPFVLALGGRKL